VDGGSSSWRTGPVFGRGGGLGALGCPRPLRLPQLLGRLDLGVVSADVLGHRLQRVVRRRILADEPVGGQASADPGDRDGVGEPLLVVAHRQVGDQADHPGSVRQGRVGGQMQQERRGRRGRR
jgi:hypothetical protein